MQKDKSLQPEATPKKTTADKSLQPEKDADGGRRTSLVYEVTDDTVTIVNDEGVYKTIGIVQVERV